MLGLQEHISLFEKGVVRLEVRPVEIWNLMNPVLNH